MANSCSVATDLEFQFGGIVRRQLDATPSRRHHPSNKSDSRGADWRPAVSDRVVRDRPSPAHFGIFADLSDVRELRWQHRSG